MARRALGPATLAVVQAVRAVVSREAATGWVVACSGGADSLVLAWAAHHVGSLSLSKGSLSVSGSLSLSKGVRAIVVDHGLQPGSDAVAARVVEQLSAFGLAAEVVRVEVVDAGGGLEASAREARYAALGAAVRAGERVLLGHTLDDQAETVLLGLARGSGLRSLAGMPAARGVFDRPLLGLGREVTVAACAELGLQAWEDPMNADPRFTRVRVRQEVMPVLERELGPGIREALARTAAQAREAADALGVLAAETPDELSTDCAHLLGLAPGLRRQLLVDWLARAGASDIAAHHVDAVERLVTHWRGQKGVDVPGGRVVRRDGRLVLVARHSPS